MTAKSKLRRAWKALEGSRFHVQLLTIIAAIAAVTMVLVQTPASEFLLKVFRSAKPVAQVGFLVFLGVSLLAMTVWTAERNLRIQDLKAERIVLAEQLASKENELRQVEQHLIRLAEVDDIIWKRPDTGHNKFTPKSDRRTTFVAVLNLKGGVGKTTLTANLAACLATMSPPKRVLVVDLDFQATLSNLCVDSRELLRQWDLGDTAERLLDIRFDPADLRRLIADMSEVHGAGVIVAKDSLERADFLAQAKFFLNERDEVRFLFQRHFHQQAVYDRFDLVFLDCPPRLTASAINALTCCDAVLIPTKLDRSSIDAVPRTLTWLERLSVISCCTPLGVVANEVQFWRGDQLIRSHGDNLQYLKDLMCSRVPQLPVFSSLIRYHHTVASSRRAGVVASTDPEVRAVFDSLASEFKERLML